MILYMTDGSELKINANSKEFKYVHDMIIIKTKTKTYMINLKSIKYIESKNPKEKK